MEKKSKDEIKRTRREMKDAIAAYNNTCDRYSDKCVVLSLRTLKYSAVVVGIGAALLARQFLSIGRA